MIEIFKHANYNFLKRKWLFIGLSWFLILAGAASVIYRRYDGNPNTHPFNVGVDFAGGTLATVKFRDKPDLNAIRAALEKQGIEGGKITLQQVRDQLGQAPRNEVLIRLPNLLPPPQQKAGESETAAEAIDDADIGKKKILAALASMNPAEAQLKTDINTIGKDDLKSEMLRLDPLGLLASGAANTADTRYGEIADRIIEYREKQRGGLIASLDEIKNLSGIDPQMGPALDTNFIAGVAALKSAEAVSPQVGADLQNRAVYVTILACIGMLAFIAFRFKSWGFGFGAVIAVFHDVLVTLGFFSIMQWEINLTVVAALLTLVGYSMNDTIVIFDRIREMMRLRRKEKLESLANEAINRTLSRTIIASGLTFLTVIAMLVFGGEVLRSFSWALFIGILIGTYSSVYIASPFMLWWEEWRGRGRSGVAVAAPAGGNLNLGRPVEQQVVAAAMAATGRGATSVKRKKGKKASSR
ncbi:MAG: protein translocase subunit SecF [Acidobacteriota bacterium]